MLSRVHHMLDSQAELIHSGDFDGVAELYHLPLSVHTQSDLIVYRNRADFIGGLQTLTGQYLDAGMLALHWRIAALELVRDNRFRVWVTWDHVYPDRIEDTATRILYYCRLTGDGLRIEMVQYLVLNPAFLAVQIAKSSR